MRSIPLTGEVGAEALERAGAAARAWGVTRLADITGLDRVGVPVFQAIRPQSRALSVHQGKALDPALARLGALMESLESAHAEAFEAVHRVAAFAALAPAARAPDLADFAAGRADAPAADEPLAWVEARRLLDGSPLLVPFECVSLDFTRPRDPRLDHTSSGLAARFDVEGARAKALMEAVERDAEAEWRGGPEHLRSVSIVARAAIPYPWFRDLDERLRSLDILLSLYAVPSVIGLPVVRAASREVGVRRKGRIGTGGWGCAPTWEQALQAAVLEAMQARLTAISGARDDILYDDPARRFRIGDAAPLPPGMAPLGWAEATARTPDAPAELSSAAIAERLAAAGYPDAAAVELSAPGAAVCVVKAFAPGLGANRRRRRPPGRVGRWP